MLVMKRLTVLGFTLMTLSYGFLTLTESIVPFLTVLIFSSIGTGLVLPCINSLITGSVGKERRGFVTSLYGSVRFLGVAIGPPIFTRLMEWSRTGMFLSIAALTLLVGLLALTLIHVSNTGGDKEKHSRFYYNYI
jgi:MFS transporter, ACDE family, multidrug resistance protein